MVALKLSDSEAFEKSQVVINRGEPFRLIVEGFTARIVKRLIPFFVSYWGSERKRIKRMDALRYAAYGLFTGNFSAIYYSAMKAGMIARWEDSGEPLVVLFYMTEEKDEERDERKS